MTGTAATSRVGIIAGSGALPRHVIDACRDAGREVFVLALEDEADPGVVQQVAHAWWRVGAAARGLKLLRDNRVSDLVLAGGMRRPSLSSIRPDWRATKFLAKVGYRALGDNSLLSAVVKELETEGFHLIGAHQFLAASDLPEGVLGTVCPGAEARADIDRGLRIARAIGALDIGQAVVIQQGLVLGVEAIEGTDELIRRCAALRREGPGGVLVKVEKPGQERRVDRPTIGPRSIVCAHAAGLEGIAAEAGVTLLIDRDELIRAADRAGLFVVGIPRS